MDSAEVLKQPLVFIRFAEAFCAFMVFICMVTYKKCGSLAIYCTLEVEAKPHTQPICVEYPFRLTDIAIPSVCDNTTGTDYPFHFNYSSQAILFVIIAVMSIIYSALIPCFYVKFWQKYAESTFFPFPDFLGTFAVSAYWLAATFNFSSGLHGLSKYTGDSQLLTTLKAGGVCVPPISTCTPTRHQFGDYTGLTFAVVFGFISLLLWSINSFLIYRHIVSVKVVENRLFDQTAYIDYPPLPGESDRTARNFNSYGSSTQPNAAVY